MQLRQDIQSLRGLAVLLVVLYHAGIFNIPGGYLGVDIFFVISGFLITGQVHRQLVDNQFSFKVFYLRRAWRILPAAYVVFALCVCAAPWLLTASELVDFRDQLIGAVTLTSNIVLWAQTDYFKDAAELKPLLHTWSLSIEEQYYLILPVLLAYTPVRKHLPIASLITISSLGLLSFLSGPSPDASFFLTPTRIWELGAGSILALTTDRMHFKKPSLSYIALLVIALIGCIQLLPPWPIQEINNIAIVLATMLLIINPVPILNSGHVARCLAWLGGISYSLYLVHWPVFAFLKTVSIDNNLSLEQTLLALISSILLAVIVNRFVEQRLRIKRLDHGRTFMPLLLCSVLLIVASYSITHSANKQDSNDIFAANKGLSPDCGLEGAHSIPACRTHGKPEMLLWGDSFAMHLVPALNADVSAKFVQATLSECVPIDATGHYKPFRPTKSSKADGLTCAKFNRQTLLFALNEDSIDTVVLASAWTHILSTKSIVIYQPLGYSARRSSSAEFKERFLKTIAQLKAAGKKVVVISPPPQGNFNVAKCFEPMLTKDLQLDGCEIERDKNNQRHRSVKRLMLELENSGIPIYRFDDNLCDQQRCRTLIDGEILYRDMAHLSVKGSALYGEKYNLYGTLLKMAR
ncbi:MAG: peptidoglycan/LPS O-acetylase OafA/YrhL [Parvicella sp.]|jgi:peptidoglycan/LPS O-acetylase OafA/YrhL